MIQWYFSKECFWLRIFGYGFCANDRSSYTPFSVRSGHVKDNGNYTAKETLITLSATNCHPF